MARTTIQGSFLGLASQAAGDVMYFNGTNWIRLAKGAADEVLTMNDGANAPEWEVAGSGAVTREGGNTSEGTMTGTSVADVLTVSSLTIAAAEPAKISVHVRKTAVTSGTASIAHLGYKENSTLIFAANTDDVGLMRFTAANQAQGGSIECTLHARISSTHRAGNLTGTFQNYTNTGSLPNVKLEERRVMEDSDEAALHETTITSFTLNGIHEATSDQTLGIDGFNIYSLASS